MARQISQLVLIILVLTICKAQIYNGCINIICPTGYRCEENVCVRQQNPPKKQLCKPDPSPVSIKCTDRNYQCNQVLSLPSCGFSAEGLKRDFENDCLPCLDNSIVSYYRVACNQAPISCNQNQECVNGKCLKLFNQASYKDYITCNPGNPCLNPGYRCIARKCVRMNELIKELQVKLPK